MKIFTLFFVLFFATTSVFATETYPNIVLILADDMGYGDVSLLNEKSKITTPNLDALGRAGMIFTDAHAACSVCGPYRYGILTGRYPMRNYKKATNNNNGFGKPVIESKRLTIAQILKNEGYDTAAFGKWHLGFTWQTKDGKSLINTTSETEWARVDYTKRIADGPVDCGFDYYFGIAASLDMVPYVFIENDRVTEIPTAIKQNDPPRPGPAGEKFEPVDVLPTLTQKAIEYINDHGESGKRYGKSFFVYMPLNAPHTPLVPTAQWQGKNSLGGYGDFVLQVDDTVGQVLNALEKNHLDQNTLVIFTVDNGFAPYIKPEKYELQGHFPSYIYRGYKGDIYDGGHRLPFLVKWKGKIKPGSVSDDLICLTDFARTFAEITATLLSDDVAEDSVSFLPILLNQKNSLKRMDVIHLSPKNRLSFRQENLKLVVSANTSPNPPQWKQPPGVELYDMTNDPSEKNNLAKEKPEMVKELLLKLQTIIDNGRSTPGKPQKNNADVMLYY
jgi:arylsulfatase A-like enzyme